MFVTNNVDQATAMTHAWGLMANSQQYRGRHLGLEYDKWVSLIERKQFYIAFNQETGENKAIIGMFTFARFNFVVENIFINNLRPIQPTEWNSGNGDKVFIVDVLAPWGKGKQLFDETPTQFNEAKIVCGIRNPGRSDQFIEYSKGSKE